MPILGRKLQPKKEKWPRHPEQMIMGCFVFVAMADGCQESISKVQPKIRLGSKVLGFNCLISSLSDAACYFLATADGDHHTALEMVSASGDALVLTVAMEDESDIQIWLAVETRLKAIHSPAIRITSKICSSQGFYLYTTLNKMIDSCCKGCFLSTPNANIWQTSNVQYCLR